MSSFVRFVSIGTVGGVTYYLLTSNRQRDKVHASWTTNFVPSSKWDDNWDFRAPSSLVHPRRLRNEIGDGDGSKTVSGAKEAPERTSQTLATRHLILVRHGQYNLDGKTDEERVLTGLGRTQAELTAKRLKELGLPYSYIVKSTMSRAQETGAIISKHLSSVPVKDCHMLREGAPIPPEPPVGHWKPGLTFYEDGPRIEAAFRKYFHRADGSQLQDSYTVLVCHANVIRYFICRALQFPPEAWLRLSLNHASISWISITPNGRVVLRSLGDSGHMPVHVITSH